MWICNDRQIVPSMERFDTTLIPPSIPDLRPVCTVYSTIILYMRVDSIRKNMRVDSTLLFSCRIYVFYYVLCTVHASKGRLRVFP